MSDRAGTSSGGADLRLLTRTRNTFDCIVNVLAVLGAILVVFLMLLICFEVVMRYSLMSRIPGPWRLLSTVL